MAMVFMERGPLKLSQKPRLIPTTLLTAIPTTDTAMVFMVRGPLKPSLRPSLIPTSTTQHTDMDMVSMARGLLIHSQRLNLRPSLTCTTDTQLMDTDMATESNRREPNFAYVRIGY